MEKGKASDKPASKKWVFGAVIAIVLLVIGFTSQGGSDNANIETDGDTNESNNTQIVGTGTLPVLDEDDYIGKEGLVVFKDLAARGYAITANYVNEVVPAANRDLTEPFTEANENSCSDMLGWDAFVLSGLTQDGDNVALVVGNEPNNNQECPAGTINDL
jgi:hypothetical protein